MAFGGARWMLLEYLQVEAKELKLAIKTVETKHNYCCHEAKCKHGELLRKEHERLAKQLETRQKQIKMLTVGGNSLMESTLQQEGFTILGTPTYHGNFSHRNPSSSGDIFGSYGMDSKDASTDHNSAPHQVEGRVKPSDVSAGFGLTGGLFFGGKGTRGVPFQKQGEVVSSKTGGVKTTMFYHSISVMPAYSSKSHEELRWEDYQQEGTQEPQTTPRAASPFSGPMWQHGTPQSQTTPRSVFPQPRYESGQAMDPQQNSNPSAPLPASASSSLLSLGAPPISQPLISLFDSSQLSNHYAAFGS